MKRNSRFKRRKNYRIESDNERSKSKRNWLNLRMIQLQEQSSIKGRMRAQRLVKEGKQRIEMMMKRIINEKVRSIETTMMMIDLRRKMRGLDERKLKMMMKVERSERMTMMKNLERRDKQMTMMMKSQGKSERLMMTKMKNQKVKRDETMMMRRKRDRRKRKL